MTILAIHFNRALTCFEHQNPCDEYVAASQLVKTYDVQAFEKGNHYVFEWTTRAKGHAGKRRKVRVPLTNISAVLEQDDEIPAPKGKP